MFPDYLRIPAAELGKGQPVRVRIKGDMQSVVEDLDEEMFNEIEAGVASGKGCTLIVPVGPVDQYPILAARINRQKLSCRDSVFINMDEYLTDNDEWIPESHPLSFRGYMA